MSDRTKHVGWVAAGLLAAAAGLTGCSSEDGPATDAKATTSNSASAQSPSASAPASSSAADQSSPEATVAAWVTAVVKGEVKQACLLMGEEGPPPTTGSEETCADDSAQGKRIQKSIGAFQESFTPASGTENPSVEVTGAPADGDKARYSADEITIDGRTLEDVILSNSTGLEKGQLNVGIQSSKLDDAWYVTDMAFDIG
ncbi:hypothetical protein HTV80_20730 [Streptomyces sp. Vc74B-19]|uniref:hypothetical protein n=1 Tax=unclassified Streptomyces TaxID=2593676 RepID=UPI001BFCCD49|nr:MULTISPECIES: hypothetical protein [unclassified Streptomyces]MBT3165513.1 hypothetical protein [Streptomyces sp. Vc74B-19]MCO4696903.1 hypothetical protein [Streptomyces sp. RO-S4]MDU0303394.1 hypothetical protein [Streptomyces sp. PAL114]